MTMDRELFWVVAGVASTLTVATGVGLVLARTVGGTAPRAVVADMNTRLRGWWIMCSTFLVSLLTGDVGSVILFALVSLLALREFLTLVPTHRADHRALGWAFYAVIPVQYWLVAVGRADLFTVLIPIGGLLLVSGRSALAGDPAGYLERTAGIHWGLMVCVYGVSHVPAVLSLEIPGYDGPTSKLLVFLVLVVEASDVMQYTFGKLVGRRPIAPTISPNKTWEGFIGGIGSATLLGAAMWWVTPFTPWQAAAVSLVVSLAGFAGGLVLSAVKRDRGVKDFGALIPGHGGVLDRMDSLCFAAPVFYQLARAVGAVSGTS